MGAVSNAGSATLTNVIVYSSLPTNNTPVFGPATIAPGEVLFFEGSFIAPLDNCASSIAHTLTATGNSLCTGSNATKSVTQSCPVTITPRLALVKNCPTNPVTPGGVLNF